MIRGWCGGHRPASWGKSEMPEMIRTANERLRSRPRRRGFLTAFIVVQFGILLGTAPRAQAGFATGLLDTIHRVLGNQQIPPLSLTLGLLSFAVLAILVLIRTRRSADRVESAARHQIMQLHADIDRLKALLLSEPQVLVEWSARAARPPNIIGDTSLLAPGAVPERVLAFGSWLEPAAAQRMEHAVETLRREGRSFVMTLTTSAGRPLEAQGRAIGGRAVLRLRDVGGIEHELMDLAARHDRLMSDVETMKAVLDS